MAMPSTNTSTGRTVPAEEIYNFLEKLPEWVRLEVVELGGNYHPKDVLWNYERRRAAVDAAPHFHETEDETWSKILAHVRNHDLSEHFKAFPGLEEMLEENGPGTGSRAPH